MLAFSLSLDPYFAAYLMLIQFLIEDFYIFLVIWHIQLWLFGVVVFVVWIFFGDFAGIYVHAYIYIDWWNLNKRKYQQRWQCNSWQHQTTKKKKNFVKCLVNWLLVICSLVRTNSACMMRNPFFVCQTTWIELRNSMSIYIGPIDNYMPLSIWFLFLALFFGYFCTVVDANNDVCVQSIIERIKRKTDNMMFTKGTKKHKSSRENRRLVYFN